MSPCRSARGPRANHNLTLNPSPVWRGTCHSERSEESQRSFTFVQDDNLRASRPRSDIPLAIMERGIKGVRFPKKQMDFAENLSIIRQFCSPAKLVNYN